MTRMKCAVLAVIALVLAGSVPVRAQAPAGLRFTVEEMLKLRRVSDPQLSPDGRFVAYVVTDVSLEKNKRVGHLWMVPVAGGEPVALVQEDKPDTSPRWSPDGRRLAFLSTRDDGSQVWVVDMAQGRAVGKPRQVTTLATEVSSFAWSPDGKWLAIRVGRLPDVLLGRVQQAGAQGLRRPQEQGARLRPAAVPPLGVLEGGPIQPPVPGPIGRLLRAARPDARRGRRSAVLARRPGRLRVLARFEGDCVRQEDRRASRRSARTATCSCST